MILSESSQTKETTPDTPRIDGLADSYQAVFTGFSTGIRPPPPIDFTLWASQNIEFGAESQFRGKYNPDLFPFFREPLSCLQPDHPAREVIIMKSAQLGGTVIAQVFVGASIDLDPGPILYVHPTIDNALRWIRTKWNAFVRQSAALKKLFLYEKTRDSTNTTLYKERRDQRGHLLVSGANSAASLSMISAARQVQDDLSKWENNESGDPESQADKRSQAFEYAKLLKISTPHIEAHCRITKNWKRSDQRKFHVPCPWCDHYQPLEWENFKQSLYKGMDPAEAHFTCPECGGVIEHHHKEQIVAAGKWVAANPDSKVPGFYIWSAYAPIITWSRIADEYFKAEGSPQAEQSFINDVVGLAYELKGEAPPWKDIKDRADNNDYQTGRIPPGALLLAIGVDVQGDRVEWLLKGFGRNLQRWTIQHGVIDGHISEQRCRDGLDALLRREWKNEYGRTFKADIMAVDFNYDKNDVTDWAKRWAESRVILVRGASSHHAPPIVEVKYEKNNKGKTVKSKAKNRYFNVGVSGLKASLYKHLAKKDKAERGYCHFPNDLTEDYFLQLTSEKRVPEKKKNGATELVWVKASDVRNEILDMEIQAEAAARRKGWHNASEDDWDRLSAARETPPPDAQLDLLDNTSIATSKTAPPPAATVSPDKKKASGRRVRSKGI